jgi:hypothetical protein
MEKLNDYSCKAFINQSQWHLQNIDNVNPIAQLIKTNIRSQKIGLFIYAKISKKVD